MKLAECITKWGREAGLGIDPALDREGHMYVQSVMPAGSADVEITLDEEPIFKEVFLEMMREARDNPGPLIDKVERQIMGN